MKQFQVLLVLAVAIMLTGTLAFATDDGDFAIKIFNNVGIASNPAGWDNTVLLSDSGQSFGQFGVAANGNICANVYVFSHDEQLQECCSCLITPNGIQGYSLVRDLTANPLSAFTTPQAVVKVVSTAPSAVGTCDPTAGAKIAGAAPPPAPAPTLVLGLIAEAESIVPTTAEFVSSVPTTQELQNIRNLCWFNVHNGSGRGVCGQTGPLGFSSTLCVAPSAP